MKTFIVRVRFNNFKQPIGFVNVQANRPEEAEKIALDMPEILDVCGNYFENKNPVLAEAIS